MSTPAHRVRYTYAEHVAIEEFSNVKHEFLAGRMYAMVGGTPEHAMQAAAASGALYAQSEVDGVASRIPIFGYGPLAA
jgi:hypothetical protein